MGSYVALLRAVNLAGHNRVAMSDLRGLVTQIGFADPRTVLQSGNIVFRSTRRASAKLERLLERATEEQLGLRTEFFVRSAEEWKAVLSRNPFRDEAERDPGRLVVLFLKDIPNVGKVKALDSVITGPEIVQVEGKQAYIVYTDGIGRSRLTNAVLERALDTRATGRNWNTVLKLAAIARV